MTEKYRNPAIKSVTAFQTLDGAVIDRGVLKRINNAPNLMEQLPYIKQLNAEATHSESYRMQLDALVPDPNEREKLLRSIDSEPWLQRYGDFMKKYDNEEDSQDSKNPELKSQDSKNPEIIELIAQALIEGGAFAGLFKVIFFYKYSPTAKDLPGVTQSNDLIIREESVHRDYAICRFKRLLKKELDPGDIQQRTIEMTDELMDIIVQAVPFIVEEDLPGLTQKDVINFSKFVADHLLVGMGYPKHYGVGEAGYMSMIGGAEQSNYYEVDTTAYQKGDLYKKVVKNYEDVDF
jgi:ribonucleotide reductase beta subunit family protein with ferritin-like domain